MNKTGGKADPVAEGIYLNRRLTSNVESRVVGEAGGSFLHPVRICRHADRNVHRTS